MEGRSASSRSEQSQRSHHPARHETAGRAVRRPAVRQRTLMKILRCLLGIAALSVMAEVGILVDTIDRVVSSVPAAIDTTRQELLDQVADTRSQVLDEIDAQSALIRKDATGELDAFRNNTVDLLNSRTNSLLAILNIRSKELTDSVAALQGSVANTLTGIDGVAKDAKDSWDDLYYDVKASTESATVTLTSAAQASEAIRDATPSIVRSVDTVSASAAAISQDVKREADELTKPKKWYQKILGPVYTVGRIAAAFL